MNAVTADSFMIEGKRRDWGERNLCGVQGFWGYHNYGIIKLVSTVQFCVPPVDVILLRCRVWATPTSVVPNHLSHPRMIYLRKVPLHQNLQLYRHRPNKQTERIPIRVPWPWATPTSVMPKILSPQIMTYIRKVSHHKNLQLFRSDIGTHVSRTK